MKAIIFDLFETLVTEWGHFKYTKRLMAKDLNVSYEIFNNEWEKLSEERYLGRLDFRNSLITVLKRIEAPINDKILNKVIRKRSDAKAECFSNINFKVIRILQYLKSHNYKLGIISNCSSEEIEALKKSELYGYFDTVILSYDVGIKKPSTEIYQLCCDELEVLPNECLYLGDGGSCELKGALQAGMKAVQVTWFIKEYKTDYINKEGVDYIENPEKIYIWL